MNGTYYQNPTFPSATNNHPNVSDNIEVPINIEDNYIENVLKFNKGKSIKVYASYPVSSTWKDSIYDGVIEESGKDYLIISDPNTGKWYIIPILYINYLEFDEKISLN